MYSEKATKFSENFTLLLTTVHAVKSKVKISQKFVAFLENMNFKCIYSRNFAIDNILDTQYFFHLGISQMVPGYL